MTVCSKIRSLHAFGSLPTASGRTLTPARFPPLNVNRSLSTVHCQLAPMSQTTLSTFDSTGFESFLQSRDEPDWLTEMRREAWEHASAMQWPERRHEEWIRTDIRTFQINKFGIPAATSSSSDDSVSSVHQLTHGVDLAGTIETLDSNLISDSLDPAARGKGSCLWKPRKALQLTF